MRQRAGRNAISTLAFSATEESKAGLITSYFTWQQLIHTSYFEVSEFRTLLAYEVGSRMCLRRAKLSRPTPTPRAMTWHGARLPHHTTAP